MQAAITNFMEKIQLRVIFNFIVLKTFRVTDTKELNLHVCALIVCSPKIALLVIFYFSRTSVWV